MSQNTKHSELKEAVDNVDEQALESNLEKAQNSTDRAKPQPLKSGEETPFIEEELRTDESNK